MFVYNPVLLMQGEPLQIVWSVLSALVGIYSLSASLEKFIFKWSINNVERVILFISALLLIDPGLMTDLIGFVVLGAFLVVKVLADKRNAQVAS